jgi:hypothetical protein
LRPKENALQFKKILIFFSALEAKQTQNNDTSSLGEQL